MAPALRVLIFIVTYNAGKHIESLLQRIPEEYWSSQQFATEILIIDDASSDDTVRLCKQYSAQTGRPMTVLKNPINQGYGGNQKIGYTYAIQNQFDVVALLHGDGQYPPEMMGQLIAPITEGNAAACFGSRMMHKREALRGGMPYYKFIGNILLTKFQNAVVGINLSEFHSGFRAYRVQALAALPFQFNSNDFDFDTDIIIQLAHTQRAITEIAIPTHYGNEVCHVNGLRYAAQVITSSLVSKLQRFQICYHPKFDFEGEKTFYPSKTHFDSTHRWAINHIGQSAVVMDIGLGSGAVAKVLKEEKAARIIGYDATIDENAAQYCVKTYAVDVDYEALPMPPGEHIDYILLLDVLEHLSNPEQFIASLREHLSVHNTTFLISTANISFILMRLSLLIGRFNYGKRGILDLTHKRLFTFHSLNKMLIQRGFVVESVAGIPVPFELMFGDTWFAHLCARVNQLLIRLSKSLFSFQMVMKVRPKPTLQHLLSIAEKH